MREFFRSWQRKAGCATLLLALVLAGSWIRSLALCDQLGFSTGASNHFFTSANGCLRWVRYNHIKSHRQDVYYVDPAYFGSNRLTWQSRSGLAEEPLDYSPIQWQWHFLGYGFELGRGSIHGGSPVGIWSIPDWLAIPLTGLSACLLILSPPKSRKANLKNSGELVVSGSA